MHAAFPIMPGGATNNKTHSAPATGSIGLAGALFPRLPFDYKWSIKGLLVHSEPAVTRLCAPSPRRQDGVTFHGECQHLFQEVPVSFGPNCRPSTRRLVSESRRGAVTFPSHPNGPVNRACECTPPRPHTPHPKKPPITDGRIAPLHPLRPLLLSPLPFLPSPSSPPLTQFHFSFLLPPLFVSTLSCSSPE